MQLMKTQSEEHGIITDTCRIYPQYGIFGLNKGIKDCIAIAMATFSQSNVVPLISKVCFIFWLLFFVFVLMWEFSETIHLLARFCAVYTYSQCPWLMQKKHNYTLCLETLDRTICKAESELVVCCILSRAGKCFHIHFNKCLLFCVRNDIGIFFKYFFVKRRGSKPVTSGWGVGRDTF